jgi:ubiquinol oxidase
MHREAKTIGDKVAYYTVKIARFVVNNHTSCLQCLEHHCSVIRAVVDFASGYRHKPIPPGSTMTLEELRKGGYVLDENGWLSVSTIVVSQSISDIFT